jgi:hypothetical protein
MKHQTNPVSRKDDILVQELKGEVLIYDLKINKAFCLNETSAIVWQLCDGNNSVADISRKFSKELNSPVTEDLVWLALDQLKQENLLSNSEEIVPEFNGMSRREVIRKVGLGTMVAIPIVSGLIAPTAAQAQTGAGATSTCSSAGRACGTDSDCNTAEMCRTNANVQVRACVCVFTTVAGVTAGVCATATVCATV